MTPLRKWLFVLFLVGIFFFTTVAFIGSQVAFPIIRSDPGLKTKFYDYAGITHSHTLLSTGSGKISTLVGAAYKAGCQFLILTDLNPGKKPENAEGYRDDVLVIWAGEYSFLGGHLLAYNLREADRLKGLGQQQIFFNDLLEKKPRAPEDGFLIAAHPLLPQHSWENIFLPGLSGMEVLNLDSVWHMRLQNQMSLLWSFLILPFNADLAFLRLYGDPNKELALWDDVLKKRMFTGFGGSDSTANAIPFPGNSFKFPSYMQSFRLMKDHVLLKSELTGSYAEDRAKVIQALAAGNFYFSADLIGDPAGFYFVAQQKRFEYLSGHTLSLSGGSITLLTDLGRNIDLPHEIALFKNGEKVATSNTSRLAYEVTSPGAYRVTVRVIPTLPIPDGKTWFTWIYSNPIRVE